MKDFLSLGMASTEGTIELEVIDIVQKGASNREENILKKDENI